MAKALLKLLKAEPTQKTLRRSDNDRVRADSANLFNGELKASAHNATLR